MANSQVSHLPKIVMPEGNVSELANVSPPVPGLAAVVPKLSAVDVGVNSSNSHLLS